MASSTSLVAEVLYWPEIHSPDSVRASANASGASGASNATHAAKPNPSERSSATASPSTDEFVRWGQLFAQDYDRSLHAAKG